MPFRKGDPRPVNAGRKKGVINKLQSTVAQMLEELQCNPFEILAAVASGELPCGVCRGKGKTKYQPAKSAGRNKIHERVCESCYGSGKERISPGERCKASGELAKYIAPQLKAIEVTGGGGGPVLNRIDIVMVPASDGRRLDPSSIQTVDG